MRREATHSEHRLWAALRGRTLGAKFRRQHPIGPYIADFYSRDAHLVVEVDGLTNSDPAAAAYDADRDRYMRALGLDVLRFTASEVENNLAGVCLAIDRQVAIRAESQDGAQWIQAGSLQPGDLVYTGLDRRAAPLEVVKSVVAEEEVYDLEVEGAHSFLTEVCAVHNCGSGTTAYVAEQWGRRWITIDTSRVALAIARQRLLTASFEYYKLRDEEAGPSGGFVYKTVPHITLKSIAQNTALDPIFARHAPILAEKLAALNSELACVGDDVRTRLLAKLAAKERAEGKKSITDADRRRWLLPRKPWEEWEVPFDTDPDWPKPLQDALVA